MQSEIQTYKQELSHELETILQYWTDHCLDDSNGGFYGRIDGYDMVHPEAEKGVVLNARILWAFAAAYNHSKKYEYLVIAERAYHYILNFFFDKQYGGVFWSLDYLGNVVNPRKQIYGLAFCIYAFAEYSKAIAENEVTDKAIDLFKIIEKNSYHNKGKGYFEAFTRDWKPIADLRLSTKDENYVKTMNTHLHILEAYANL